MKTAARVHCKGTLISASAVPHLRRGHWRRRGGGGKAAGSGGDMRHCDGIWATMCRLPFCTCGQRLARVVISVFMSRNELNAAVCVSEASAVAFRLHCHLAVFSLHPSVFPYGPCYHCQCFHVCLTVPTKMSRETVLSMLINIIHIIPTCPNFVVS